MLGQCNLVLLCIKWKWVSTRLLCLYILKKSGGWVGCYHSGTTNEQTRKDRATQPIGPGAADMSKKKWKSKSHQINLHVDVHVNVLGPIETNVRKSGKSG